MSASSASSSSLVPSHWWSETMSDGGVCRAFVTMGIVRLLDKTTITDNLRAVLSRLQVMTLTRSELGVRSAALHRVEVAHVVAIATKHVWVRHTLAVIHFPDGTAARVVAAFLDLFKGQTSSEGFESAFRQELQKKEWTGDIFTETKTDNQQEFSLVGVIAGHGDRVVVKVELNDQVAAFLKPFENLFKVSDVFLSRTLPLKSEEAADVAACRYITQLASWPETVQPQAFEAVTKKMIALLSPAP